MKSDKLLKEAIIELYLNVKIRNPEEVSHYHKSQWIQAQLMSKGNDCETQMSTSYLIILDQVLRF